MNPPLKPVPDGQPKPKAASLRRPYDIDILIRGWDNFPFVRRLLQSIRDNTEGVNYAITYVDNGSTAYDFSQLLTDFPGLTYVRLPFNHGSVRAINIGLTLALMGPAKLVLLMDSDTEVPKGDRGWLKRLAACFDDPAVGYVGAVSNYVAGYQHCEAVPDNYTKAWQEGDDYGDTSQPDIPLLVSFAMMLRKDAVKAVGLFDERFEPGNCEDYDYCLQMRAAGWKGHVANSVWIHHKGSQTFQRFDFQRLLQLNQQKLFEKWGREKLAELGVQVEVRNEPGN